MKKFKKSKFIIKKTSRIAYAIIFVLSITTSFYISSLYLKNKSSSAPQVRKSIQETADNIVTKCNEIKSQKKNCYSKSMLQLAKANGYDYTYGVLQILQKTDTSTDSCHGLGHEIGEGLYQHDKKNWRDLFNSIPAICASGIHHGLVEAYLSEMPIEKYSSPETLRTVCTSYAPLSCYHTIGHLLYVNEKGDADKAINDCHVFSETDQKSKCYRGVFMENITPNTLRAHGFKSKALLNTKERMPNLLKLCQNYENNNEIYFQCWGEMSKAILEVNNNDAKKSLDFCDNTSNIQAARQCENRIISLITTYNPLSISSLKEICFLRDDAEFNKMCHRQLVSTATEVLPVSKLSTVINYCNQTDKNSQAFCFWQIGNVLKGRASLQEIKNVCAQAPEQFQDFCLGKNNNFISSK